MWTTASGGSGGTLNRNLYEQFTIQPAAGYSVRVDSLVALIGYISSKSNTKIAVVYSKSNFTTDSTSVTGGRDYAGLSFPVTSNGAFTTPILDSIIVVNSVTTEWAFALNVGNGVMVNAGETLTIRIYFSCGSTSAGRYAVVKNVQAKGTLPTILPLKFTNYQLKATNEKQVENTWSTANEINVSHFNIQRSSNGKDFITIGKVNASNKVLNEYSFIDNKLPVTNDQLTLYYRLTGVDKDGKMSYSETKTLNFKPQTLNLVVYPNPASSIVTIESSNAKELLVTDYLGKVVYIDKSNRTSYIVNLKSLTKGIYLVKAILNNGDIKTSKLIVE